MRVTVSTKIMRYGSRDSMDFREWEEDVTVSADVSENAKGELVLKHPKLDDYSMPGRWTWRDLEGDQVERLEWCLLDRYSEISESIGHPADCVGVRHE